MERKSGIDSINEKEKYKKKYQRDNFIRFFLLTVIVLSLGSIYYLIQANTRARQAAIQLSKLLEKQNDSLSKSREELLIYKDTVSYLIDSLDKVMSQLSANQNTTNKFLLNESRNILTQADNLKYTIALHSLNPKESTHNRIIDYVKQQGYNLSYDIDHSSRPNWMANRSTVFYYDESSRRKAASIADELSTITNEKFAIQRGAGLGVLKGQEKWTIFIHYIPSNRITSGSSE